MKRLCYLLITCLVTTTAVAQQPVLDSIVNPASLKEIIQVLAADSLMGRFTGSAGQDQAADYIAGEFRKAGLAPVAGYDGYFMPFTYSWNGESKTSKNIVAVLPGNPDNKDLILFSAHYDHIGTLSTNPVKILPERGRPEKGDTIYNGANDNASGISAIISMARYFGKVKNNERTIVFIAFSGEELGLIGSRDMTKTMDIQYVKAMINMDMLGIPTGRKNKNPFITGYQLSDLPSLLNQELYQANPGLYGKEYFKRDPFYSEHLFSRSDNFWFAMQGIPAHTIIATSSTNQYYHSLNDEPGTLDYNNLAVIIKAIVLGSVGIITGTQTPGRLKIDRINNY